MITEPCKHCGMPIDRKHTRGRKPEYCDRPECYKDKKAKQAMVSYYNRTGRPELARYARMLHANL